MISQHSCLLFFCSANLENRSFPGHVMDWEAFGGGKTKM